MLYIEYDVGFIVILEGDTEYIYIYIPIELWVYNETFIQQPFERTSLFYKRLCAEENSNNKQQGNATT